MAIPHQTAGRLAAFVTAKVLHPAFLPVCVFLYVALRVLVVAFLQVEPDSDAVWYYNTAVAISEGRGYIRENGEATAYWPVGYPAFLGGLFRIFGAGLGVVAWSNVVLSIVSLWALYRFALHTVGPAAARLAVLGYAIYPNAIGYMPITWSETLFTTLLLLGALSYVRATSWPRVVFAGVLFGAASLVKTQAVLLPPILFVIAFLLHPTYRLRKATFVRGVVFGIATLATIAPWTIRNYMVFDQVVLVSTNGGISLLCGNNPSVQPDYHKNFNADDALVRASGYPPSTPEQELEVDAEARRLATEWMRNNPGRFAELIPHKLFQLWARDGEADWAYQANTGLYAPNEWAFKTARWANQGFYLLVLLLVLASVFLAWRTKRDDRPDAWLWVGCIFALYFTALCIVFSGQSRYHAPLMPLFMINAAFALRVLLRLPSSISGNATEPALQDG